MLKRIATTSLLIASISHSSFAAEEHYEIDPTHTYPNFEFSHMGISIWRGKFNRTTGHITLDRANKTGNVTISIDPASINFGLDAMDEKARSEDFFNVEKFPSASYVGKIIFTEDKPTSVNGEITLLGVKRPVILTIHLFNCIPHPMLKHEVCGADASGEINWSEFGMKLSQYGKGDAGNVHLSIQVEATKQESKP